jgi:hypothetical protein
MKKESIEKAMKEIGVGELAASHNAGSQQPTIAGLTRADEIEKNAPATNYKLGRLFGFRPAEGTWSTTRESIVEAAGDIAEDIERRRGYAVTVELFSADGRACGDNTDGGTMLVTRK